MDKLAKSAVRKEDIDIYITLSKTEVKSYKMFYLIFQSQFVISFKII